MWKVVPKNLETRNLIIFETNFDPLAGFTIKNRLHSGNLCIESNMNAIYKKISSTGEMFMKEQ